MALITTTEAAARLHITRRRVRAMIESGVLRAEKLGRDWFLDEEQVERLRAAPRPRGRPKKNT